MRARSRRRLFLTWVHPRFEDATQIWQLHGVIWAMYTLIGTEVPHG